MSTMKNSDSCKISNFCSHLSRFRDRPGMVLEDNISAENLSTYLAGWQAHRHYYNDHDGCADYFFSEFHRFIENKYSEKRTIGWQGIITEQEPDGKAQIRLFFSLFDEFLEQLPIHG